MKIKVKHNETSVEFENVNCNDVKSVIQIMNETMIKIKGPFVVHQQGEHLEIKPETFSETIEKRSNELKYLDGLINQISSIRNGIDEKNLNVYGEEILDILKKSQTELINVLRLRANNKLFCSEKKLTSDIDLDVPPAPISFERVKSLFERIQKSKWKNEPVLNDTLRFLNDCRILFYGENRDKTIFQEIPENDE